VSTTPEDGQTPTRAVGVIPDLTDWISNAQARYQRIAVPNDLAYRDMALLLRTKAEHRVTVQVERYLSRGATLQSLVGFAQRHLDSSNELASNTGKTVHVIDAVVRASALAERAVWIKLLERLGAA
jgi:hypothetical protein